MASGKFLLNPAGVLAKPLITITGSGDIALLASMRIIQLTGIEDGITLDSKLKEAYYCSMLLNT